MTAASVLPKRYLAVDMMRGGTLALMILVNMAISDTLSYGQLLHSVWHGFTLADAIFPCFLFVVGSAMALTFERPGSPPPGWDKILRRAVLLIACGIFVSNFPFGHFDAQGGWEMKPLANLRLPGVLQRIGLCYLIGAAVIRLGGPRAALGYVALSLPLGWVLGAAFGNLTLEGSAALKWDAAVFGLSHLYTGEGQPFDPEGLLGAIPSTGNLLAGYLALRAVLNARDPQKSIPRLMVLGLGLVAIALIWAQMLPINKKLWTSSFALLNVGLDVAILVGLVWLVDLKGMTRGSAFLAVFGKNSLALYMIAEVLMGLAWTFHVGKKSLFMWLFDGPFMGQTTTRFGSLLFGLAMVGLCWAIGWWMDKRRIYVRL